MFFFFTFVFFFCSQTNFAAKWHVKMRLFNLCAIHFHGSPYTVQATVEPHTRAYSAHSRKASKKRVSVCMEILHTFSRSKKKICKNLTFYWRLVTTAATILGRTSEKKNSAKKTRNHNAKTIAKADLFYEIKVKLLLEYVKQRPKSQHSGNAINANINTSH